MNKTSNIVIVILSFLLSTHFVFASNKPSVKKSNRTKVDISKTIPMIDEKPELSAQSANRKSVGGYTATSPLNSPGVVVGDTWYDYQHNGTMGRMIETVGIGDTVFVHFGWMRLLQPSFTNRHYGYASFKNSVFGTSLSSAIAVQPTGDYGGYVSLTANSDGDVIIGGHNQEFGAGFSQPQIYYWDFIGFPFWDYSRIPDSVASYDADFLHSVRWPKIAYQEGSQDVTHVIAQHSNPAAVSDQAMYYFRKVGDMHTGVWDYPPYVVDTIHNLSHDIVADNNSDKVAIAWTANLTYTGVGTDQYPAGFQDDTLSGESPIHVQWDNDVYYQISDDQGVTWNNRVNITKNRLGEAGYRPYTDLSTLIDSNGDLHVAWSGVPWPEDPASDGWSGFYCRLFMWSENVNVIRTVASAEWSSPDFDTLIECYTGAWNLAISKMQVSECDGKLYVLWTQYQDPLNGITDDCAARANGGAGDLNGSANGELFISVSFDYGLTFDQSRNITNSYSKDCDPANGGLDCDSDAWPSMTKFGRQNIPADDWSMAEIIDPSGSYAGDYYLDVQYIHDKDAGGIVQNEGTWQNNPVKWFRLACVDPVLNPLLHYSPISIELPTYAEPGSTISIPITLENNGNVNLNYSPVIEMDNNSSLNWLSVSGLTGLTPSGFSNTETGSINLGSPTTVLGNYTGRIILISNAPGSPDTIPINFLVADTIIEQRPDTIFSACLALGVDNNGAFGLNGAGGINLDWTYSGAECDSNADVYLYDGSPVILWIDGADTIGNWSIFGNGLLTQNGLVPLGGEDSGVKTDYNWYNTGTFVTHDSSIGLSRSYYGSTDPSDCDFIVQKLEVWSYDGLAKSGITIGEAIDWDIPSDSGNQNESSFDVFSTTIYQSGAEYGVDTSCQDSDTRFGGVAFFESYKNGSLEQSVPYNMFTGRADSLIYPTGNFVPGQLYTTMQDPGYFVETATTDQFSVMTYDNNLTINSGDTAVFWTVLATVQNGTVSDLTQAIEDGKQFI
ncbi:MAG: hypothetical protein DWP97_09880, partial [Calditrichaeota bacterium]